MIATEAAPVAVTPVVEILTQPTLPVIEVGETQVAAGGVAITMANPENCPTRGVCMKGGTLNCQGEC